MIIAVDYDGTLAINGKPNMPLIARLRREQASGSIVILWTCRNGKSLAEAVQQLAAWGLKPNYVNANCPQAIRRFGGDTRKVYADLYIDDKSLH